MVEVQRKPELETCFLIRTLGCFFSFLPLAFTSFCSKRFLHQFNRLNHFFKVAAIETEILFQARPREPDLFPDGMNGFTEFLGIIALFALGLREKTEQTDGHQTGVVEFITCDCRETTRQRFRCAFAFGLQPGLDVLDAVALNGFGASLSEGPDLISVEPIATAEG